MPPEIRPVILCGGAGTRLWPLSRQSLPKQFVPLVDGRSLLTLTFARAGAVNPAPRVVAAEAHRFLVAEQAEAAGVELGRILLEPAPRNTAAAIALAALDAAPGELLLFLPADHYLPDSTAFAARVAEATGLAEAGWIVALGITPDGPSTAYGYLRAGSALPAPAGAVEVAAFVEKPERAAAEAMLARGGHLWNAGIFLARAETMLEALAEHAPDILEACRTAMAGATRDGDFLRPEPGAFLAARSESIDYAVMEKAHRIAALPLDGVWSDVGSWQAVAALAPADADGNRIDGRGWAIGARDSYLRAPHRPVVALGVEDLMIVDTPDALLVAHQDRAEEVKAVVGRLAAEGVAEATQHSGDARPWGSFDVIDRGERFQVKRITVKPGARLSLQSHHHRAEHWVVVRGTARVRRDDEVFLISENQSTYIPLGALHSLENPGRVPLEIIEVQSGSYLGEDDIVRYEDQYGRAAPGAGNGEDTDEADPGDKDPANKDPAESGAPAGKGLSIAARRL